MNQIIKACKLSQQHSSPINATSVHNCLGRSV